MSGVGRVQRWGSPIEEIRPEDVVWIPPGEKHWHGAVPATAMTHTAIQEKLEGKGWTGWSTRATSNITHCREGACHVRFIARVRAGPPCEDFRGDSRDLSHWLGCPGPRLAQGTNVSDRWLAEEAAVFAVELRRTLVANFKSGAGRV